MKTPEMFKTLVAFANLAEAGQAEELRRFARAFSGGKEEAVAARVKRVRARWKATPVERAHPPALKACLVAIGRGLSASGAKKPASDVEAVLSLFEGSATVSVDSFVQQVMAALSAPPVGGPQRGSREKTPDHALARQLVEELASAGLDSVAFARVADRLRDPKLVSTPTLGAVANLFLGNSKNYSGRKAPLDDIVSRQKQDARSHARSKALDRIGAP